MELIDKNIYDIFTIKDKEKKMNNFVGSIDTDMSIGTILSNFETPWIMHTVHDSLNMKFRPFDGPMPNFPDILNRQFNTLVYSSPDYKDKVEEVRLETNKEIIEAICEYYSLEFKVPFEEIHPVELYSITRTLYDIFISRFTDYMIEFFIEYIINNINAIYTYLLNDDTVKKPREKDIPVKSYIDPKFLLIHANLNKVIYNMISYDIPFESLLKYFLDGPRYEIITKCIADKGDIYRL